MPLSAFHDDPALEALAREVFALFPTCQRCGRVIDRFEDADVRIHVQRVVHRAPCARGADAPAGSPPPDDVPTPNPRGDSDGRPPR
jgi:hypothetical protein